MSGEGIMRLCAYCEALGRALGKCPGCEVHLLLICSHCKVYLEPLLGHWTCPLCGYKSCGEE